LSIIDYQIVRSQIVRLWYGRFHCEILQRYNFFPFGRNLID